jgi:hypothetical protein
VGYAASRLRPPYGIPLTLRSAFAEARGDIAHVPAPIEGQEAGGDLRVKAAVGPVAHARDQKREIFPALVRIGERAIAWPERVVQDWLRERIGASP